MAHHAVVIAGGGPTGLMLAGELALADGDVVVVEPRADQHVEGSRAGGLLPRSIEVLDQRGIADRFLDAGYTIPAVGFAGASLDISDFPSRHNVVLALWQSRFEPILADWVAELGVPTLRGREVARFAQDDDGVEVELDDETTLRGQYLVGCDGGRSVVRRTAGIDFVGADATTSWLIAEVEMTEEPEAGMKHDELGSHGMNRLDDGPVRLLLTDRDVETAEPTLDDLRNGLVGVYGTDFGVHSPRWISRFTDATRQAVAYRDRRVLLAGDAAHIHPPHGGQGMGTGLQDAVNLGWKLAQVVDGTSPDTLLDTYHAERHPVAARVLRNTMVQVLLQKPDTRHQALRELVLELATMDGPRRRIAGELSALDVHYDVGEGHPLLGRRMPDLDLNTADGSTRVFELLHDARPVLLNLRRDGGCDFDATPWPRVKVVDATFAGGLELPVVGAADTPSAVLIRPDGHVAWTGELDDPALPESLATWFGSSMPRRGAD